MDRTAWTDERIDDAFAQLREEMREMRVEMRVEMRDLRQEMHAEFRAVRADMAQMKMFMLGGLLTILTAFIATNA